MKIQDIFIINLDRRPDRFQRVSDTIASSDLSTVPIKRVSAVDYKQIDIDAHTSARAKQDLQSLKILKVRSFHSQLTPGAVGCYLSHVNVWKTIAESNLPDDTLFLILEDDATVPAYASVYMRTAESALKALGVTPQSDKPYIVLWEIACQRDCQLTDTNLIVKPSVFWSLQAYTLSVKTAKALLRLPLTPIENQLDTELQFIQAAGLLDVYAYPSFPNKSADTDIQIPTRMNAPLRSDENDILKYIPFFEEINKPCTKSSMVAWQAVVIVLVIFIVLAIFTCLVYFYNSSRHCAK